MEEIIPIDQRKGMEEVEHLLLRVRQYREPTVFDRLMTFVSSMRTLSPYNAWLVNVQMPGARAVLSANAWRRDYNRRIAPNARPIIILQPFGPIALVWDISNTVPENSNRLFDDVDDIIESIAHPFKTYGEVDSGMKENLFRNLSYDGIILDSFSEAATSAARIEVYTGKIINVKLTATNTVNARSLYMLSLNQHADTAEKISSIFHELAHVFCHHLIIEPTEMRGKWVDRTDLSHAQKEFEAECAAWIVCSRIGLKPPTVDYLRCYVGDDNQLPPFDMGVILKAAGRIERMLSREFGYKDGLLWKHDEEFHKNATKH